MSSTIEGLSPGTSFTFSVTAMFCNRTSSQTFVNVMTNFSALTSVNVTAMGTILSIFWESDQDTDIPVWLTVAYRQQTVYRQTVQSSPYLVQTNRSGVCFTVTLQVVNSTQSQRIVHATEPAAPEEVYHLQGRRLTNNRRALNITWSPPAVTNGIIEFYRVTARGLRGLQQTNRTRDCDHECTLDCHSPTHRDTRTSGKLAPQQSGDSITTYSMVVDELSEYENYIVEVTAYTSAGGGPSSSVRVDGQLLDSVSEMKVVALNSTCLNLTWAYPQNANYNNNNTDLIYFLIEYQTIDVTDDDEVNETAIINSTNTGALLCGLQYWTRYEVNITAIDQQGPGRTISCHHRTAEHVPGVVSNMTVSVVTTIYPPRAMNVTWAPPIHVYGVLNSYFVTVRDTNTSRLIEVRQISGTNEKNAEGYKETFLLVGDHHYHVEVFAATNAGNGTKAQESVLMPAGALPPTLDTVSIDSSSTDMTSALVHIPTSLLCDFTYGVPVHAGYIVYPHGRRLQGIRNGISEGSLPVLTDTWAQSDTAFFVQLDVFSQCERATGNYLSVRVGDRKGCDSGRGDTASGGKNACGGRLRANTQYHFLVVFCTSQACTYSLPDPVFRTLPEPVVKTDSSAAGLGAGLAVVFLVMIVGAAAVTCKMYKKRPGWKPFTRTPAPPVTKPLEVISKNRPVALDHFIEHVQQLHRDSNLGFSEEYKTIKDISPVYATRAAELLPCKPKNRYTNILPWDRSRVKLIPTDDEEGSDYINANYLPGENHQREFIAAQGPLPGTIDDFWRMVWENRVCVIVMLTQCIEKGKTKCEKYWPDEGVQTIYGDLMVQVRSQSVLPDYIIRVVDIKLGNQSRMIKHFHFMRWPDHGCPERTSMLLNFVSSVRAHMPHSGAGPTLVHCSAGVGRTGTFIALDRLLLQIRQRNEVDIFNLVFSMREHRMQMVQTENQYVYIHDCLADALTKDKESDDDQSEDDEEEHIYGNC